MYLQGIFCTLIQDYIEMINTMSIHSWQSASYNWFHSFMRWLYSRGVKHSCHLLWSVFIQATTIKGFVLLYWRNLALFFFWTMHIQHKCATLLNSPIIICQCSPFRPELVCTSCSRPAQWLCSIEVVNGSQRKMLQTVKKHFEEMNESRTEWAWHT